MSSDQADGTESTTTQAAWRLESFSDWTIIVKYLTSCFSTEEGGSHVGSQAWKTDTYNVHRCYIAVVPRPCSYFSGIMTSGAFQEGGVKTTEVIVDELTAKAFPKFLDFIYTGKVEADGDSIIPLRWLAKYFGNDSIGPHLEAFAPKCEELLVIYEHAKKLDDEGYFDVIGACLGKRLAKAYERLSTKELKKMMSPDFVRDIVPKMSPPQLPTPSHECSNDWDTDWLHVAVCYEAFFTHIYLLLSELINDLAWGKTVWQLLTSSEKLPSIKPPRLALHMILKDCCFFKHEMTDLKERCLKTLDESNLTWTRWEGSPCQMFVEKILRGEHPPLLAFRLNRITVRLAKEAIPNKRQRLS